MWVLVHADSSSIPAISTRWDLTQNPEIVSRGRGAYSNKLSHRFTKRGICNEKKRNHMKVNKRVGNVEVATWWDPLIKRIRGTYFENISMKMKSSQRGRARVRKALQGHQAARKIDCMKYYIDGSRRRLGENSFGTSFVFIIVPIEGNLSHWLPLENRFCKGCDVIRLEKNKRAPERSAGRYRAHFSYVQQIQSKERKWGKR